jgi:hypothetical protein
MTEQDELSRLARAITNAEDNLNESNHRDDCETLAQMDETRSHLIERIDAREKALDDARDAFLALAKGMADDNPRILHAADQWTEEETAEQMAYAGPYQKLPVLPDWVGSDTVQWTSKRGEYQTAEPQPYSNGLDGHKED